MSTPITLRNLRKTFGATAAVDGVDLDIPAGSLFFLLGPSGCGKTTLLRTLAGFTEPTAGSIRFGTRDVTALPANKRDCGMVFQGYALWPHMTVRQNVAFGLTVRKIPPAEKEKRADAALQMVQMLPHADRKPNELSGGQQQRVALARAMVIEPVVLLLDEPLSNLDAKLRIEMRSQIKDLCKQAHITAVYVTHDQKEALSMADQMAVMRDGKLIQTGPPAALYHRPVNRFVADFLGQTNFISAQPTGRDRGRLLLASPAGPLASASFPENLPTDGSLTCSIRPEAIRLSRVSPDSGPPTLNSFEARHVETLYLGEMAQHTLAVGDALLLRALELNPRPADASPITPGIAGTSVISGASGTSGGYGGTVRVSFDPQDVVILQD